MDQVHFQKTVENALQKEIETVIAEECEKAAEEAKERVRRRIKEMTVKMAANILQRFQMSMRHDELVIRVLFSEDEK